MMRRVREIFTKTKKSVVIFAKTQASRHYEFNFADIEKQTYCGSNSNTAEWQFQNGENAWNKVCDVRVVILEAVQIKTDEIYKTN